MKQWRTVLSGLLAAILIATVVPPAVAADELDGIADPALHACLTRLLTHYADPSKLETVWCEASDGVVEELTGLDSLTGVKNVVVMGSRVTDLSVVRNMPGLIRVGIQTSESLDPAPLAELSGLQWLLLREPSRT
ncbi:MAG: hypothetical protein KIT69_19480, partial [Propionibacteriaceae bacterium]|nr:hypothetical protein [Propionibacteriaceae bacterium]